MRFIYIITFYIIFIFFSTWTMANPLIPKEALLYKLTSPWEAERYNVLEQASNQINQIDVKDIEKTLTSLRKKNVSTLIYVLIETQNDILYNINTVAKKSLENSEGSFPNIAYYYGRINCQKGIKELFRLYSSFPEQKLFICKAIGETGTDEALNFLLSESKEHKKLAESIFPFLAGLKVLNTVIDKKEIEWFISNNLNREELISLSYLDTNLTKEDILQFYDKGEKEKEYAIQHIFGKPLENFEIIKSIVQKKLTLKEYDKILEWMMSDNIRLINNHEIQEYRENMIEHVRNLMSGI